MTVVVGQLKLDLEEVKERIVESTADELEGMDEDLTPTQE